MRTVASVNQERVTLHKLCMERIDPEQSISCNYGKIKDCSFCGRLGLSGDLM